MQWLATTELGPPKDVIRDEAATGRSGPSARRVGVELPRASGTLKRCGTNPPQRAVAETTTGAPGAGANPKRSLQMGTSRRDAAGRVEVPGIQSSAAVANARVEPLEPPEGSSSRRSIPGCAIVRVVRAAAQPPGTPVSQP